MLNNNERFGFLDSLRGIAALTVVFSHFWLLAPLSFRDAHAWIRTVSGLEDFIYFCLSRFNDGGRFAVILFFVLSGFVLACSLQKQATPYISFAVKRVFRIYPTFLFVILCSYVAHSLIGVRHEANSDWLSLVNHPDLSLQNLARHIFLSGTRGSHDLDGVVWTLVHEMRISLVFPFILALVNRYQWRAVTGFGIVSFICSAWVYAVTGSVVQGLQEDMLALTFVDTGYFMIFFAAGAYVAINRVNVISWIARQRLVLFGLASLVAVSIVKSDFGSHTLAGNVIDYARGVGAVGLIALALGMPRFRAVLNHASLIWLGRISYSLYLVHIPILYIINQTVSRTWPVSGTALMVLASSLFMAELIARYVEFPSLEVGKRLAARIRGPA